MVERIFSPRVADESDTWIMETQVMDCITVQWTSVMTEAARKQRMIPAFLTSDSLASAKWIIKPINSVVSKALSARGIALTSLERSDQ